MAVTSARHMLAMGEPEASVAKAWLKSKGYREDGSPQDKKATINHTK